jgi:hypothetical protein
MLRSTLKIIVKNFQAKKLAVCFLTLQAILLGLVFGLLSTIVNSFATYEAKMAAVTNNIVVLSLVSNEGDAAVISELEEQYNFRAEAITHKYFKAQLNQSEETINVFARTRHERFALDAIVAGRFPRTAEEIAIGSGFAKKNGIKVDEALTIAGTQYTVVGTYQHPREYQLYDLTKSSDLDLAHNMPLIVTDTATIADETSESTDYYAEMEPTQAKELLHSEHVLSLHELQLDMLTAFIRTNSQILYVSGCLILCVIIISIFLQVKAFITTNSATFGVLISMGVRKRYIVLSHAVIGVFIACCLLFGCEVGKRVTDSYFFQVETTYNMVIARTPVDISLQMALIVVLCLLIIVATFIYVARLMRHTPLAMMRAETGAKTNNILVRILARKGLPFALRMQIKNTFGNALTTLLICASLFSAIFLFQFSFSLNAATDALIADYGALLNFTKKSYYELQAAEDSSVEFVETEVKVIENARTGTAIATSLRLQAIDVAYNAMNFTLADGSRLSDLDAGEIVVPMKFAETYDISLGDTLVFIVAGERLSLYVRMINDVYLDEYVYTSKATVDDVFVRVYGTRLSNGRFDATSDASFVIEKEQLLAAGGEMSATIRPISTTLRVFALVLLLTTLVLFSQFIIQKHNKEITLLIAEGRSPLAAVRVFVNYFNGLMLIAGAVVLCANARVLAYVSQLISRAVGYRLVFLANVPLVVIVTVLGLMLFNAYLLLYYNGNKKQNLERILKMEE